MPIYVYAPDGEGCEECRAGFEVLQQMDSEPLARCPECDCAVHRVPATFSQGKPSVLSSTNLKDHGFKKLRRADDGGYVDDT